MGCEVMVGMVYMGVQVLGQAYFMLLSSFLFFFFPFRETDGIYLAGLKNDGTVWLYFGFAVLVLRTVTNFLGISRLSGLLPDSSCGIQLLQHRAYVTGLDYEE